MDKFQALHSFWSSFAWDAIDEQSSYEKHFDPPDKYITYEAAVDSFDSACFIGADLWHRSLSWAEISQKAEEISEYIGRGGVMIPYTGGALWITRGAPFAQRMAAETTEDVRRIHLNINAEYLSA